MKVNGILLIGMSTFKLKKSQDNMLYIEYLLKAPKELMDELLASEGCSNIDSSTLIINTMRDEQEYYEPFKTGKTKLNWEEFKYFDQVFLS